MNNSYKLSGISSEEINILEVLEGIIKKAIPIVYNVHWDTLGVKIEEKKIIGLGLYRCKLNQFPEVILKLESLRTLSLGENRLKIIPDSIKNLGSLRELNLGVNQLKELPEMIGDLKSLKRLDLKWNQLNTLPESISKLKDLEYLNLRDNQLSKITEAITELKSLKTLHLRYNNLSNIPETLAKLESLKILHIQNNKLTSLPLSIGNLSNLIELSLSNNTINSLPKSIGRLSSLQKLILENNKLESLPESIKDLSVLNELKLNGNNFKVLPVEIWGLNKLRILNMMDNPLDEESKSILNRDLKFILEYCRQRATISIFLSHAVVDFDYFHIKQISEYLEKQDEIYNAYYCEDDLIGKIDDFMNETIPKCQILLFFASNKSVFNSVDCAHELDLARKQETQIIPIISTEISWNDLSKIGLSRDLGFEFNEDNIDNFCKELYDYIIKFKHDVNLYEPEEAKIDRHIFNINNSIKNFIRSKEFKEYVKTNTSKFEELFQELSNGQISPLEYSLRCFQILSK